MNMEPAETIDRVEALNATLARVCRAWAPPVDLSVTGWAEKFRRLDTSESARPGPYRVELTPYMRAILDAWTDPAVERIVVVGGAQLAKTSALLNMLGYAISEDPANGLCVFGSIDEAKKFAKLRLKSLVDNCPRLRDKVKDSKENNQSMLQRTYPGGSLFLVSSKIPNHLAAIPCRYVFIDECDRLADNKEGSPIELAIRRTTTFRNKKIFISSTPTNSGTSNVEQQFNLGDQAYWCYPCPHCGVFSPISSKDIKFDYTKERKHGRHEYSVTRPPEFACPECGCISSEREMKAIQSAGQCRWISENPDNLKRNKTKSFWLNSFSSNFISWKDIINEYLNAKDDPNTLRVVKNTLFAELWGANEGTATAAEDTSRRREHYSADVPGFVRFLTAGIDTQDDYFFASVFGWGPGFESAAIAREIIPGRPDSEEAWRRLDLFLARQYERPDGLKIGLSGACLDTQGHFATHCYRQVRKRAGGKPILIGIKGQGGEDRPLIAPPKKIPIRGRANETVTLINLGSDQLKHMIFSLLREEEPGPRYVHFPFDRGFDIAYFEGLFSEVYQPLKTSKGLRYQWRQTHSRNEPLDTFCYAYAATQILGLDLNVPIASEEQLPREGSQQQAAERGSALPPTIKAAKPKRAKRDIWDRF